MPRTDCSWRTVSSVDSAWGQQGWGGLGLHAMLGFNKVKRPDGRWRRGGETRVSTRNQEQWRGEAGRGGDAVTLSGDVGRAAEACSPNGFPSGSTELMPPAEAAEENWESRFRGQDRVSVGLVGQGVKWPGTARQRLFLR